VRRGTDIINAGTSRRNVMFLAARVDGTASSSTQHHYLYARVLGAYHANVIYTGPGMRDYEARRFDFLWVRWFEVIDPGSSGWNLSTLDTVHFPPIHGNNSFGFVDPKDVLRGCHILPRFSKGKRHSNGVGVSRCAKDGKDYKSYYVGRYVSQRCTDSAADLNPYSFSDRDLLMRYHWGLGVGHLHAHQPIFNAGWGRDESRDSQNDQSADFEPDEQPDEPRGENAYAADTAHDGDSDVPYESDNPELWLDESDVEGLDDLETDSNADEDGENDLDNDDIEYFGGM
jgi:hypothetical protein